jgi:UV DNA damage endonuclease
VGGTSGGIAAACDRFLAGCELLTDAARRRLVIENDDRAFGTQDVVQLGGRAGLRVVWDVLHHHCHDPAGMSDREAIEAALATWPGDLTPKIHYSSPRLDVETRKLRRGRRVEERIVLPQLRAHADLVDPIGFERFMLDVASERDFDVMLEAKAKDLALLRLRDQLTARGLAARDGRLVVPAGGAG